MRHKKRGVLSLHRGKMTSTVGFTGLSALPFAVVKGGEVVVGISVDGDMFVAGEFTSIAADGTEFHLGGDFSNYDMQISRCPYCGTNGGQEKYHQGTCANCGGIL